MFSVPLPLEFQELLDESVQTFRERLGVFAWSGTWVEDYRREVERVIRRTMEFQDAVRSKPK